MLDYRVNTFLTLCEEMNYRRTANRLNMTQPGVTQHIHHLENYYGAKLFEYNGKTLTKTKNAEILKKFFDSVKAEETDILSSFTESDITHLTVGATKTIGEYVIVSEISQFLNDPNHSIDVVVDNTKVLLSMLEKSLLDFAIVEGVFDKSKYDYHLYKKESFVGICSKYHPFANNTVKLEELLNENLVVRESSSGTRALLENAISDRGFSFDSFKRYVSVSNFSVICDLIINNKFITFAYEPISKCREDLAVFTVKDMQIYGEFNFVYCNERIAKEKINLLFRA